VWRTYLGLGLSVGSKVLYAVDGCMVPGTRFCGFSLACANAWEMAIFGGNGEIYWRFLSRNLRRLIIRAKRMVPAIKRVKEWGHKRRRNFVRMSL
jgi:hypothetical protein